MAGGLEDIAQKITQSLDSIKERENQVKLLEDAVADDRRNVEQSAQELEAEKERIAAKEQELEEEKKLMERYPVADDDVVELNVQGKIMTTLRGTLTEIPNNGLACLFNGRWEDKIHRDKEGRVFLDFIPQLFRVLLDYLTTLRLARPTDEIPLPKLAGHKALEFQIMVRHLGLEEALFGSPQCFSRILKSSSVMLSDDCMVATSDSDGMCFALGEGVYSDEKVEFVFEIQKLEEPWMFLGIIKDSEAIPGDNSFNGNPGAFGWAGLGGVWVGGYRQAGGQEMPLGILKSGLVAHLTLDCRKGREAVLELQTESDDALYKIDGLPSCESWRLHINMVGCGDTIKLVDVKRQQK
ncbi:hypothetical protein BSKO_01632 [Bryopsis sp. KO-2023]|nr:hypothetical protein BSKO_01632 [Bryopsis sp. KO-2023]